MGVCFWRLLAYIVVHHTALLSPTSLLVRDVCLLFAVAYRHSWIGVQSDAEASWTHDRQCLFTTLGLATVEETVQGVIWRIPISSLAALEKQAHSRIYCERLRITSLASVSCISVTPCHGTPDSTCNAPRIQSWQ